MDRKITSPVRLFTKQEISKAKLFGKRILIIVSDDFVGESLFGCPILRMKDLPMNTGIKYRTIEVLEECTEYKPNGG